MFNITTETTQKSSQNIEFEMFGQNTETSNLRQQPFGNLGEGESLSARNSNFNNPLSVNPFENLGGGNPLPNNNNLPPGGLDLNVAALVNALTGMNLTGGYYLRKGSFIKLTKFGETEIEDPNEWLERFNRIAEVN